MDGSGGAPPIPPRLPKPPAGIPYDAAMISDRPGWLARLLGARYREDRGYRMRWGEWSWRWGLTLELANIGDDHGWSLIVQCVYGKAYISLPFLPAREPEDSMESWGFSWRWETDTRGANIHLNWRDRCKILHLPWDYGSCIRHDMLCADGVWRKYVGSWQWEEGDPEPARETHPYRYVCRNGTVQNVSATITVDEMEWRWRALWWFPWFGKIQRTVNVEFDQEVGERRGSWKGGCTGCDYEMRRGETPLETLRRMQRDRRFD